MSNDNRTRQGKNDGKNTKNTDENASDHLNQDSNQHDINQQGSDNKPDLLLPDVILLAQLLPALSKAGAYLRQILNKLAVDAETVAKMPYSFTSNSKVWNLKQAKENLDILLINAILRNPQQIKYKEWIVELELKKAPEAM